MPRLLLPTLLLGTLATPANLPAMQEVVGSATFRERMAVPPGATFEATLEDVSRADAPAKVVTRLTMEGVGNPPYMFVLPYRPEQVTAGHRYAVRTTLRDGHTLLFTSDIHIPALEAGTEPIRIVMVRAAGGQGAGHGDHAMMHHDTGDLTGVHWTLVELGGAAVTTVEGAREPHLMFVADSSRYHGTGGCNRVTGSFERSGNALKLGLGATTRMMCPPPVMAIEDRMLTMLGSVASAVREGDTLTFRDAQGGILARFTAKAMNHEQADDQEHDGCS